MTEIYQEPKPLISTLQFKKVHFCNVYLWLKIDRIYTGGKV